MPSLYDSLCSSSLPSFSLPFPISQLDQLSSTNNTQDELPTLTSARMGIVDGWQGSGSFGRGGREGEGKEIEGDWRGGTNGGSNVGVSRGIISNLDLRGEQEL